MIYINELESKKSALSLKDLRLSCLSEEERYQVAMHLLQKSPKIVVYNIGSFDLHNEHRYQLAEELVKQEMGHLLFSTLWDFALDEEEIRLLRQQNLAKSVAKAGD